MHQEISPQFLDSVLANLLYWKGRTADLDLASLAEIDRDRTNLFRAVEFGLYLPQTRNDAARLAVACFPLIVQRWYYREWIPILEKAAALCGKEALALKGRLLDQLGIFYRRNREFDAAVRVHLEEERIGRDLGDKSRTAFAAMHLGEVYWRKRQYEKAEEYSLAALEFFSSLNGSEEKVANCLSNLGNIALGRGDHVLAEERLKESIDLYRDLDQPANLAAVLKSLANVHDAAGNYQEALLLLVEAADILAPTDYEIDKSAVEINIGTQYFRQGELDLAESAFNRANSSVMRETGPLYFRALIANNLGNVYLAREQWDRAKANLERAISLWRKANAQIMLANSLSGVAEALVGKGEPDCALPFYDEAIEIVSLFPDDAWARRLFKEFTEARKELGDRVAVETTSQIG